MAALMIAIGRMNVTGRLNVVYVQVDNEPMKLFAEGPSGNQAAPWIEPGHLYVFVAHDPNGREVARDRLDLRRSRR